MFKIAKAVPHAVVPKRADSGAAGYDLSACESQVIPAGKWARVDTGIMLEFPGDCYARVAPRSGLAFKNGLDVFAGVVDSSYRGTVAVILMNHSGVDFTVKPGDRIAQLIFERIYTPELVEEGALSATERGAGGFGSSGV